MPSKKRLNFIPMLIAIAGVSLCNEAKAATFNVSTSAQLQNALTTAQSNHQNDLINIAAGTYLIPSGNSFAYVPVANETFSLVIQGSGTGTTTLNGNNLNRIMLVKTTQVTNDLNADITIKDIHFQNGNRTGLYNGNDTGEGAGLWVETKQASVNIEDCAFIANHVDLHEIISGNETHIGTAGGALLVSSEHGNIRLYGSYFEDNSVYGYGGGAALFASGGIVNGVVVRVDVGENYFGSNLADEGYGGGLDISAPQGYVLVRENVFENDAALQGGEIHIYEVNVDGAGAVLMNNVFSNNSAQQHGGAVRSDVSSYFEVVNNTFYQNQVPNNGGAILSVPSSTISLYNNIFFQNGAGQNGNDIFLIDGAGNPITIEYNLISEIYSTCYNTPGCVPQIHQNYNINGNPLFVNAVGGDFHLQGNSPCINQGAFGVSLPDRDFEGDLRVIGDRPDIGADEFAGTPAPICGNGILEAGEGCDDGNGLNTDACLNTCVIATCGDGFVRSGTEQCDDHNTTNGDGCSSTCTIEVSAGKLSFSANSYSVNEAAGNATITINRSNGSNGVVNVTLGLSNGTAQKNKDYGNPASLTVSFTNGQTQKIVSVPIINDNKHEQNETFNVTLTNPTGGASLMAPSSSIVTIVDND